VAVIGRQRGAGRVTVRAGLASEFEGSAGWSGARLSRVTRDDLLELLARLWRASVGGIRAPHKPLLLLWLFGRFAAVGSTVTSYAEAEEPVSDLINEFGPPVASAAAARRRVAMPFVHLERELWDLRDGAGAEIGPDAPERGAWLKPEPGGGPVKCHRATRRGSAPGGAVLCASDPPAG